MTDPYPAIGSNYRPNIEPSTTNRGSKEVVELYDKVKLL